MCRKLPLFVVCYFLLLLVPLLAQNANVPGNFIAIPSLSALPLPAASPTLPALVISKQVREVDVVLSVTDHKGRFVQDLTPSDLTVIDNGQKQDAVTFFQSRTGLPLRVALLLDMSASVGAEFNFERSALGSFLRDILRPADSALLIAFNNEVKLVQPATSRVKDLTRAMRRLKPRGETAVFDAVSTAAEFLRRDDGIPSRRVIILVSDGQENSSHTSLQQATASALQANASIYTIGTHTWEGTSEAKSGVRVLKTLAEATGGQVLHATSDGDVGHALGKIRRELRSQYALGYRPSNLSQAGLFHHLQVLAPPALRVHCRIGYYAR